MECWRKIQDFPNYEISSFGRVRNLLRQTYLNPYLTHKGRPCVSFPKGNIEVHVLVMRAFVGPRPTGLVINHKDGNKSNNRIENLEYVTQLENVHHAMKNGLNRVLRGEQHGMAKLTAAEVSEIRSSTVATSELAKKYGVTRVTIWRARAGINWK